MGITWRKEKEKTAGFLFVKPTGSLHQVTCSPGTLKKPKNQHRFLCFGTLSLCI